MMIYYQCKTMSVNIDKYYKNNCFYQSKRRNYLNKRYRLKYVYYLKDDPEKMISSEIEKLELDKNILRIFVKHTLRLTNINKYSSI